MSSSASSPARSSGGDSLPTETADDFLDLEDRQNGDLLPFLKAHIGPLLKLNDEIRRLTNEERDINVSSIVVFGDQSHGKTSVIEAISGVDLPRGRGIQTRVPLELRLRGLDETGEEYATIASSRQTETKIQLAQVSRAVQTATEQIAGNGKDVVDDPVVLTIHRKDQINLTLIDLPGMTRAAVRGQRRGIEETLINMYRRYMVKNEHILVNVVSAAVDFSTSKSLQMSQEHDPRGSRTLMVVTKPDTVPHRDDLGREIIDGARDMQINARKNAFCVVNRNEQQNAQGMSLAEMREAERAFFEGAENLADLPQEARGVANLSRRLAELQFEAIKQTLPEAAKAIEERIRLLEADKQELGEVVQTEPQAREVSREVLWSATQQLQDELRGARPSGEGINTVFAALRETLKTRMEQYTESKNIGTKQFADDLRRHIEKCRGADNLSNAEVPQAALNMIKLLLKGGLREMVREYVHLVKTRLEDHIVACFREHYEQYPFAWLEAERTIHEEANSAHDTAAKQTNLMLDCEEHSIYTDNRYEARLFEAIKNGTFPIPAQDDNNIRLLPEYQEAWRYVVQIYAYWESTTQRMLDQISKTCRYFLMDGLIDKLRAAITKQLDDAAEAQRGYIQLFKDNAGRIDRLMELNDRLHRLKEARKLIAKTRAAHQLLD